MKEEIQINGKSSAYKDPQEYEKDLSEKTIGAAIEVHKQLGPGLLESAYQACLAQEYSLRNLHFEQEKPLPAQYKGMLLDCGYRLDFVIENKIVVELKTVPEILPVHESQLLTYLRLTNIKVGLLINFYIPVLYKGIRRLVL